MAAEQRAFNWRSEKPIRPAGGEAVSIKKPIIVSIPASPLRDSMQVYKGVAVWPMENRSFLPPVPLVMGSPKRLQVLHWLYSFTRDNHRMIVTDAGTTLICW